MKRLTENILKSVITPRPQISHKGTFGRAVLIGGNTQFGGAIIMAAQACVSSGAGLTTIITDPVNRAALHTRLPEVMIIDKNDKELTKETILSADVLLIGPGLGLDVEALEQIQNLLIYQTNEQWLVIDGSAITLFAQERFSLPFPEKTIFTPHQMEWQRVSALSISEQTVEENKRIQQELGATIVLKSYRTQIYSATKLYENPLGNPAMATGGMGDTLAGMLTAFLAQFPQTPETIGAAVYLHSYIGDALANENYVVLPTMISERIPYWMKYFSEQN
ncbi:YjeF family domain-containing protein [Enterococcus sp. AZ194]|uniref:NAD(P)H-hydrate dehydratase n=1 Tax=Enterococcus sp. AZ194 TaxID=2774629 RepID=UPI003F256C9D